MSTQEKNFRVRVMTPKNGVIKTYWDLRQASRAFQYWLEKTNIGIVRLENIHNGFIIREEIAYETA